MLNGLTREVRWRDVTDGTPQETGYVLVAYLRNPTQGCFRDAKAAYWNGREFMTAGPGCFSVPIREVTHWMPYPALPSEDAMRRVFWQLLGTNGEESTC